MTLINRIVGLTIVIFLVHSVNGQQKMIKELTIGDLMPDINLTTLVNYPASSIRISDFKGKLLILDFWATWCSPCVAAFPKLDSLQQKFADKIQILPVTVEDSKKAANLLKQLAKNGKTPIATVANDTILSSLFKHNYLPHYVWINGNSEVVAITEEKEVNEFNIESILQNKKLSLPFKVDNISVTKPRGNRVYIYPGIYIKADTSVNFTRIADSILEMSSTLTGYIEGASPGGSFDSLSISLRNHTVLGLYSIALLHNTAEALNQNKFQIEIRDSVMFEAISGEHFNSRSPLAAGLEAISWLRNNAYTYELKVPAELAPEKFKIMLDDLNRYFGVKLRVEGVVEKRSNKFLALMRTSQLDKIATKEPRTETHTEAGMNSLKVRNGTIKGFVWSLSLSAQGLPFIIDETGYKGQIDLSVSCKLSDLTALNKELMKYDLQLVEKVKVMDVAILRIKD